MHQYVEERLLDYASFVSVIKSYVEERLGEEYEIRIFNVVKNNSLELDSLIILKKGKYLAPNVYLLPYYEAYLEGIQAEEIAGRIINLYESWTEPPESKSLSYTFEAMKPYILFRLVSFERNLKLLKDIPHVRWLDLAVTFHCLVKNDEDGIKTIRITNRHMEQWGIETDSLKELAGANTSRLFPASIKTLEEVLCSFDRSQNNTPDTQNESKNESQNEVNSQECLWDIYGIPLRMDPEREALIYVLTNQMCINGAACLLYNEVLSSFSDRIGSDLFILPSSIHEVLLVPGRRNIRTSNLAAMVREINNTQLSAEEVLSDNIYFYSRKDKSISII